MLKKNLYFLFCFSLLFLVSCDIGKKNVEMVVFGDSIMEEWYKYNPDFFEENNFSCEGRGGEVSSRILSRLKRYLFFHSKDHAILINAGTNDVAGNEGPFDQERTLNNIKSMAEVAKKKGLKVILSSVLPTEYYHWNTSVVNCSGKIENLNSAIKEYGDENGFMYVDFHSKMKREDGGMQSHLSEDGSHPNKAGYEVMEAVLSEVKLVK